MKCISLTQPWSSLVARAAKKIETRSWPTSYRGPLAIHAAKAFPKWAKDLCLSTMFLEGLGWPRPNGSVTQAWLDETNRRIDALPRGVVLATCRLVDCIRTEDLSPYGKDRLGLDESRYYQRVPSAQELAFGDYSPGRWAWLLEDIQPLAEPIPAKGALGLWEWKET